MQTLDLAALEDAYPLARAGGLFMIIVGAALALGASRMRQRYLLLGIGAAVATAATIAFATSHPIARPSNMQLLALATAIAFEITAFAVAGRLLARRSEREQTLTILAIVGAHLLLMAPAFGPVIVALGALCLGNAGLAAAAPRYALPALWFSDGVLKLVAGAAMLWGQALA